MVRFFWLIAALAVLPSIALAQEADPFPEDPPEADAGRAVAADLVADSPRLARLTPKGRLEPDVADAIQSASFKTAFGGPAVVSGGLTTLLGVFLLASTGTTSRGVGVSQPDPGPYVGLIAGGLVGVGIGALLLSSAGDDLDEVTRVPTPAEAAEEERVEAQGPAPQRRNGYGSGSPEATD